MSRNNVGNRISLNRKASLGQFGAVLGKEDLLKRLQETPPLVEDFVDVKKQIGLNGIDLTVERLEEFETEGALDFTNEERVISKTRSVKLDENGWTHIAQGCYKVVFSEVINMPNDLVAVARPRSSLLRSGASVETAVWDAGYRGRSVALLNVFNPFGLRIKRGARIAQIVFLKLRHPTREAYGGVYQMENI